MHVSHAYGRRPGFEARRESFVIYLNPARPLASRQAAKRAAQALRASGVRQAVFTTDFPATEIFLREGIRETEPWPLLRALAPALALKALEKLGIPGEQASVILAGRMPIPEAENAIALLYPRIKNIFLYFDSGAGRLQQILLSGYGVSALTYGGFSPPSGSSVVLLFSEITARFPQDMPVLALYDGEKTFEAILKPAPEIRIPSGFDPCLFLSELYMRRKITPDQVVVADIIMKGT